MATMNPFDLLGDADTDDLNQIIAAQPKKDPATAPEKAPAKVPTKGPAAKPAHNVKEAKTESGRQGGRGGERGYNDRGYGRGGGGDRGNNDRGSGRGGDRGYTDRGSGRGGFGYNKDQPKENSFNDGGLSAGQAGKEDADGGKTFERRGGYNGPPRSNSFRGGRRGEFNNGEVGNEERPRRNYERRSGTGRGYEVKREGAGRGNWGTASDEITQESAEVVAENDAEKNVDAEKPSGEEEEKEVSKEAIAKEAEDKEAEDKEMTLQEYEKVLEEKRKALQALKTTEERKVDDKAFATMQPLSSKKNNDEIFAKLGADKKKELAEKEEKAKKTPVSINEFLKPAEGEKYFGAGGRRGGRGGGRGGRGPREGGYGGGASSYHVNAPKIEDPGQFPVLGAK